MRYRWNAFKQASERNRMVDFGTLHRLENNPEDNARTVFQHERDRIVWSPAFRRLAHKTQIFPHRYGDHHRCRLTHSLEVMQLSTSIARTLGLNDILCEAIALGHDLGHTPFGHAGEEALDNAFRKIEFNPIVKGLKRFTHYEQGVDVVTYLDDRDPIKCEGEGLDLSIEVREGILKHTMDYKSDINEEKPKCLSSLLQNTKYEDLAECSKHGTVESQAVRMCDKISYLISDLEDGIRIGAVHWDDMRGIDILEDAKPKGGETEYTALISSRSLILTLVIDALLKQSLSLLEQLPEEKKSRPDGLVIIPTDDVWKQMDKIYKKIQKPFLVNNINVKRSNERANQIVSCLLCQYLRHPELIPWRFRARYRNRKRRKIIQNLYHEKLTKIIKMNFTDWHHWLEQKHQVLCFDSTDPSKKEKYKARLDDIISIKDYIAGMTDNFAEECYNKFVDCPGSNKTWTLKRFEERIIYLPV